MTSGLAAGELLLFRFVNSQAKTFSTFFRLGRVHRAEVKVVSACGSYFRMRLKGKACFNNFISIQTLIQAIRQQRDRSLRSYVPGVKDT